MEPSNMEPLDKHGFPIKRAETNSTATPEPAATPDPSLAALIYESAKLAYDLANRVNCLTQQLDGLPAQDTWELELPPALRDQLVFATTELRRAMKLVEYLSSAIVG